MTKNETNIAVEILAKSYVTGGIILTISNKELSFETTELVKALKERTTKVHPLPISFFKQFIDNGLKDEFQSMHKILRIIDLNDRRDDDVYTLSNELLAFSLDNPNNLLVVVKDENNYEKDVELVTKVANAIGINILAIDQNEDFKDLSLQVESYLFK